MNKFVFNATQKLEEIAQGKNLEQYSERAIIKMLAQYNHFIRHLEYQENRMNIKSFVETMIPNINMNEYAAVITKTAKGIHKYPIIDISSIEITKSELEFISSFENIKQEKILFTLLAMAKYNYKRTDGKHGCSILCKYSELFKRARVAIPIKERPYFMQFATMGGFVDIDMTSNCLILKPLYVSTQEDDEVVLRLGENEFAELGYTYCAWKEPNKWRRCNCCNVYFKKYKNKDGKDAQYCKNCKTVEVDPQLRNEVIDVHTRYDKGIKRKKCIECEKKGISTWFEVNNKNNTSTMCSECYKEHRKQQRLESYYKCRNK